MSSVEVAMVDDSVEVSDNLLWQANAGPCTLVDTRKVPDILFDNFAF